MHCWIDASGQGTTSSKDAISHLMLPYKRPLLAGSLACKPPKAAIYCSCIVMYDVNIAHVLSANRHTSKQT